MIVLAVGQEIVAENMNEFRPRASHDSRDYFEPVRQETAAGQMMIINAPSVGGSISTMRTRRNVPSLRGEKMFVECINALEWEVQMHYIVTHVGFKI